MNYLEGPQETFFFCEGCGADTISDDDCGHGYCLKCVEYACRVCEREYLEDQRAFGGEPEYTMEEDQRRQRRADKMAAKTELIVRMAERTGTGSCKNCGSPMRFDPADFGASFICPECETEHTFAEISRSVGS